MDLKNFNVNSTNVTLVYVLTS